MSSPARPAHPLLDRVRALRARRWFRWSVDLALLLAVVLGVGAWQTRGHLEGGRPLPLVLPALSGEPVALETLRGRPVLVAVWAPWCPVCKANSGAVSWAGRLAGDRARVISIAAAYSDVEEVRAHARAEGLDHPVLLADDAALRTLRVASFPTYYFLDAEGRVKRSATGYTTTLGLLLRLWL